MRTAEKTAIEEQQAQSLPTKRAVSPGLEDILYEPFSVLDHGFIRVVDYMGDDEAVVQAARVSYGRGTKKLRADKGLINYLMRHRHSTPFEMCEIKFHVKLPIFVARQWIRHRTANVNEYSARYSILDKEFYLPKAEHLGVQSATNRQGRGPALSSQEAQRVMDMLKADAQNAYAHYQDMINEDSSGVPLDPEKPSVARELARMNLSTNYYTQWYWKVDLHNLMNFISLRADAHAQYEIRVYAQVMADILQKWCPFVYEAFMNYRLKGTHLSHGAKEAIKALLQGESEVDPGAFGLSAGEWREVQEIFSLKMK